MNACCIRVNFQTACHVRLGRHHDSDTRFLHERSLFQMEGLCSENHRTKIHFHKVQQSSNYSQSAHAYYGLYKTLCSLQFVQEDNVLGFQPSDLNWMFAILLVLSLIFLSVEKYLFPNL